MEKNSSNTTKTITKGLSVGSMCFLAYTACYIGKNILSCMMSQMTDNGAAIADSVGIMVSAFLFAYGAGQLFNGFLGDLIPSKWMVSVGLFIGGTLTLILPIVQVSWLAIVMWAVCGFSCSMLYGPITSVVGNNTTSHIAELIIAVLGSASSVGTAFVGVIATFTSYSGAWTIAFTICGFVMIACAVGWFLLLHFLTKSGYLIDVNQKVDIKASIKGLGKAFNITFILVLVVTMTNGIVRNAATQWIPKMLRDYLGFSEATSQIINIGVQIVHTVSAVACLILYRLVKNNDLLSMLIFSITTAIFFIGMFAFATIAPIVSVVCLYLAIACNVGLMTIIFSPFVLRFKDLGKISGISGFLDFCSYLSAAIVNIAFTGIATSGNWGSYVIILAVVSLVGSLFSGIAMGTDKKKANEIAQ